MTKSHLKSVANRCTWLAALTIVLFADVAAVASPVRAFYWNIGDGAAAGPATDAARVARFKALGVSEVHLWLNDNKVTPACGYLFHYSEGEGTLWTPARLAASTRALQAAGIKVVYIFSPDIRTAGYIASLSAPGGPLEVAAHIPGVDIELDIEGNGETSAPCPDDGLSRDDADRKILQAIRKSTPASKIVISTTRAYDVRHPVLMAGADAIGPQLYSAHYAETLAQATAGLVYFRETYPTKPIWVALSVECSRDDASAGHCSRAQFESEVNLVSQAHASNDALVPKYVIWGQRESKPCPTNPVQETFLCSVFAEDYLTDTKTDGHSVAATPACSFQPAFRRPHGNSAVWIYESAAEASAHGQKALLLIVPDVNVNTDGTRISYKIDDPRARHGAINNIGNALHNGETIADFEAIAKAHWKPVTKTWQVLSNDVIEKSAQRKTMDQPCTDSEGYLVSKTSVGTQADSFSHEGDCRQDKWLDALTVPAFVLPRRGQKSVPTEFDDRNATNRSIVVVMTLAGERRLSYGIVGDKGPVDGLGEASVAMNAELLGLPPTDLP